MNGIRTTLLALVGAALMCGTAGAAYDKLPKGLARLTPEEVSRRIEVTDDPLEPYILVSTRGAWARGRSIDGAHANDVHLRALVDRGSGAVQWQVWHELVSGRVMRDMTEVSYRVGGRPQKADVLVMKRWSADCPSVDAIHTACNQYARLVFELPGSVVQEIADAYSPGHRAAWRLRFTDARGATIAGGLAPAEASGLVEAVTRVRHQHLTPVN
ncbi:hypothetical protein GCM10011494_17520 [Novosphingobium endophyticum]|uniref:Uncharacterized protein n=1 Tax=Novosphingobium endophyticum TaxID=1955250 RepID=A0A916X4B2_9SPHN|nr:hypothetical protein [Novosphingobium endophyticum]GGB99538.1 hypothetical protein GCM10011494_17520 [Novosphingobium endophyticum]